LAGRRVISSANKLGNQRDASGQWSLAAVLAELRLLSAVRLDSHVLLTIALAGDRRLVERFRSDEFVLVEARADARHCRCDNRPSLGPIKSPVSISPLPPTGRTLRFGNTKAPLRRP
jgi:hypothetical protein